MYLEIALSLLALAAANAVVGVPFVAHVVKYEYRDEEDQLFDWPTREKILATLFILVTSIIWEIMFLIRWHNESKNQGFNLG